MLTHMLGALAQCARADHWRIADLSSAAGVCVSVSWWDDGEGRQSDGEDEPELMEGLAPFAWRLPGELRRRGNCGPFGPST